MLILRIYKLISFVILENIYAVFVSITRSIETNHEDNIHPDP